MSDDREKRQHICVIGSANVDLTFRLSRIPSPGETLAGRSLDQCMGGKGANQAVVAARLGATVTFLTCVGDDRFGAAAIDAYSSEGIDTSFIQVAADQPTGTAAILVDDTAENCIVVVAGANACLTSEKLQPARPVIEASRVLLAQLETPASTAEEAFGWARAAGVLTVLTPAPAANVSPALLRRCDVCVPNTSEMATLVGRPLRTESEYLEGAKALQHQGVKHVVLTMGHKGVLLCGGTGAVHLPAPRVDAVDTTGAGDAFTGALAVGLAAGMDLEAAARRAIQVAALSVTRAGTQPSFPTAAELAAWHAIEE